MDSITSTTTPVVDAEFLKKHREAIELTAVLLNGMSQMTEEMVQQLFAYQWDQYIHDDVIARMCPTLGIYKWKVDVRKYKDSDRVVLVCAKNDYFYCTEDVAPGRVHVCIDRGDIAFDTEEDFFFNFLLSSKPLTDELGCLMIGLFPRMKPKEKKDFQEEVATRLRTLDEGKYVIPHGYDVVSSVLPSVIVWTGCHRRVYRTVGDIVCFSKEFFCTDSPMIVMIKVMSYGDATYFELKRKKGTSFYYKGKFFDGTDSSFTLESLVQVGRAQVYEQRCDAWSQLQVIRSNLGVSVEDMKVFYPKRIRDDLEFRTDWNPEISPIAFKPLVTHYMNLRGIVTLEGDKVTITTDKSSRFVYEMCFDLGCVYPKICIVVVDAFTTGDIVIQSPMAGLFLYRPDRILCSRLLQRGKYVGYVEYGEMSSKFFEGFLSYGNHRFQLDRSTIMAFSDAESCLNRLNRGFESMMSPASFLEQIRGLSLFLFATGYCQSLMLKGVRHFFLAITTSAWDEESFVSYLAALVIRVKQMRVRIDVDDMLLTFRTACPELFDRVKVRVSILGITYGDDIIEVVRK